MTIHVRHLSDNEVEVTLTPGWLGRLLGRRVRRGLAERDECNGPECGRGSGGNCQRSHWWWKATERHVGIEIEREIECTTVEELPVAAIARRA